VHLLDLSGLVGGVAGVEASEDAGDVAPGMSGSSSAAALGVEEAVGGVVGSVAAAQGERDSCDVRERETLDTGVSRGQRSEVRYRRSEFREYPISNTE